MAGRVDASVHPVQTAARHAPIDLIRRQTNLEQLRPTHHPVLAPRQVRDGMIRGPQVIRAPFSVYMTANGASIHLRALLAGHATHAALAWRACGAHFVPIQRRAG